jgi:hypothetical protein
MMVMLRVNVIADWPAATYSAHAQYLLLSLS